MIQNMLKRNNKIMMNSPLTLLQGTCDVFQQDVELIEHCKDRQRQWEVERRLMKRKKNQGAYQELQLESLRKDVDDLNDLSKTICFAILDLQNHSTKLYCNNNQADGHNPKLSSDGNPVSNIHFNDVNYFKKGNALTDNNLVKEIKGTISLGDRLALLGQLKIDELLAAFKEEIEKEEQDIRNLEEKYQRILNENKNLKKNLLEREVFSKKQEEKLKENIENLKESEENKTELKKLQNAVSDLESINKSLNADIEVTKESLNLNVQERARAFVLLRDAKRENRDLQERLQAHEKQSNINFSDRTKSDDFEIKLMQSELKYYKEMLENKNDFIQELQQQIDTYKVERLEIQEEMFTKEKDIESLQSIKNLQVPSKNTESVFPLTRQDSKNKSMLKKQELYIVSLQKEIDSLKEELIRCEKEKNNADKEKFLEIEALKETYENQIKEHVIAEQDCRVHLLEQKEQVTCLRNELQVLIKEKSFSQSETHSKSLQDELTTSYENIIEKTQSQLEQSARLIKHLQEERRKIKLQYNEEMTTMRKQIDQDYQTVITEIKQEKVHVELEIETLRKELHLVQCELENSRSELNSSKQLLKLIEKDLESSKEELVVAKQKLGRVSSFSISDGIENSKSDIKQITAILQQELQIHKQKEIDAKIAEENLRGEVDRLRRELSIIFAQSNKHDFLEGHGKLNEMKEPVAFQRSGSTENL